MKKISKIIILVIIIAISIIITNLITQKIITNNKVLNVTKSFAIYNHLS